MQPWKEGQPTPGVAQGGIQGGSYAAGVIRRRVLDRPHEPFRYRNKGDVAVIGRLSGVTNIPWLGPFGRQGGFTAWLLWLGIHIAYLIGFANRIVRDRPLGGQLPDPRPRHAADHRASRCCPRSRSPSRRSSPTPEDETDDVDAVRSRLEPVVGRLRVGRRDLLAARPGTLALRSISADSTE